MESGLVVHLHKLMENVYSADETFRNSYPKPLPHRALPQYKAMGLGQIGFVLQVYLFACVLAGIIVICELLGSYLAVNRRYVYSLLADCWR